MRKTGSKKIRFKKIFLLPICVSKTILIVLQSARRVNDDLAARLNIFHDRDHLLLWNSDASAGRAVFCGSILWFPPRRRSRHSRWRTNPRSRFRPSDFQTHKPVPHQSARRIRVRPELFLSYSNPPLCAELLLQKTCRHLTDRVSNRGKFLLIFRHHISF